MSSPRESLLSLIRFDSGQDRVFWVINILLPDHLELPHVLDLAVHLVHPYG